MNPRTHNGLFITFEGVDGCGKSTQMERLCQHLKQCGYEVVRTREPGGTEIAEAIRNVLLDAHEEPMSATAELLLYAAARAQHVARVIRPALEARAIVVCDRFVDSTTAYQGGGRGVSVEILQQLSVIATAGLRPDLTLVIDVPADVGLVRSAKHKRMPRMPEQQMQFETDRMERELISFHERVRAEFLRLAREEPDRVKVVDGTKSIAEVAAEVRRFVDALIGEP